MEILKHEIKKNLLQKKVLLVLILLIVLKALISLSDNASYPSGLNVSIYKEYMEQLEGPHNSQKLAFVNSEIERYDELRKNKDLYIAKYRMGEITAAEFRAIKSDIDKADDIINTLYFIQSKANYYETTYQSGIYFFDLDIERYINGMNIDYCALIFILFIVALIFATDYQKKTEILVRTSMFGGRYLLNVRLILLMVVTVLISSLFQISEFIIKFNTLEIQGMDKPVKSLLSFMNYSFDITITEMFGVLFVTRLMFLVYISIIAVVLSFISKSYMGIISGGAILVVIPDFIVSALPKWLGYALPSSGYNGILIYNNIDKMLGIPSYMYAWGILAIITGISLFGVLKACK